MYGVEVLTPPADVPVTAAALRARLRLHDSAEDADLADFLAAAVELFEHDTGRPVLATTYRQYLSRWPFGHCHAADPLGVGGAWVDPLPPWWPQYGCAAGTIILARGGVTAVGAVKRLLADGSAEDVTGWAADLHTPPARVALGSLPAPVVTAAGVPVRPVGYVEYTAGWATAGDVPPLVRTAIMLLAGHWYENREAFTSARLADLPAGWCRVTAKYKTGLTGDWGQ